MVSATLDARTHTGITAPTTASTVLVATGILGFASGAVLAVVEPSVSAERFSYPLTADGFTLAQIWFALHHVGLLVGLVGLRRAGVLPGSRVARWGWGLAFGGMVGLTLTELVAVAAAGDAVDTTRAVVVGALYGLDCTAIGVGLVLAGVAVVRARSWTGWRRWVVLSLGVWVFVPMFPALILTPTDGARWAIGGWMLLFAALGVALREPGRQE